MGKFTDNILRAIRGRRAAKRVKWPEGFKGMVMWCPRCAVELVRVAEGHTISAGMQQAIVDAHNASCKAAKLRAVENCDPAAG